MNRLKDRLKILKNKKLPKNIIERLNMLRNRTSLIIIGIIVLTLGIIGISYAIFTYINRSGHQIIRSGSLVVTVPQLKDDDLIIRAPLIPMSHAIGNAQPGYEFTINNIGTLSADYTVKIISDNGNQVNGNQLYASLDGGTPFLLADSGTTNFERIIKTGKLGTADNNKSVNYVVRVWLKETWHDASVVEDNDIILRLEVENTVAT